MLFRRRARARSRPPCCSRPGTSPGRASCRCCSTRTAGRTRSGCSSPGSAYLVSQWFAEQGFAVLIADGRGTPGRGPEWERAVAGDLAGPVLEDQVDALAAAAAVPRPGYRPGRDPRLVVRRLPGRAGRAAPPGRVPRGDRGRAGHRLAAVRHPLHRALPGPAGRGRRRLRAVLAHFFGRTGRGGGGRAAAHADPRPRGRQRGGGAHAAAVRPRCWRAGYPHTVLPLSGITHMASQETVAENLLLLQLDFLRSAGWAVTRSGAEM